MPGDCAWLESRVWVAETVARYEAERAAYNERLERQQAAQEEREAQAYRQRIREAQDAVRDAVDVLGLDVVLELVNEIRYASDPNISE